MTSVARTRSVPPSRWAWAGPVALGAGVALATAVIAAHDPNQGGVYPACASRELLGVDCPGCGGLRAVHALTQGDLARAADHNLLAVVALPLLVVGWAWWLLRSLGAPLPAPPRLAGPRWMAVGVSLAVAVIAFGVVRNLDGVAAFAYLHSDA